MTSVIIKNRFDIFFNGYCLISFLTFHKDFTNLAINNSVIQIAKDLGIDVEERKISVDELVDAQRNGTLDEIFISGTAATILNIDEFGFKSERFSVQADGPNKISARIKQHLLEIREGSRIDMHEWRLTLAHSSI